MGNKPYVIHLAALVALPLLAAGCMPSVLPGPLLRTATPAPVGRLQTGAGVGVDAGLGADNRTGPVVMSVGDARALAFGRVGLGRHLDLGVTGSSAGARLDLGWQVLHGTGGDVLLDPSLAGGIVPGGICGGMDCVFGTSVFQVAATLPVVISIPLGSARFTAAPAATVSWASEPTLPAPLLGQLRDPGVHWSPALALALDLDLGARFHLVAEVDGRYAPDVFAGTGGLSVAFLHE